LELATQVRQRIFPGIQSLASSEVNMVEEKDDKAPEPVADQSDEDRDEVNAIVPVARGRQWSGPRPSARKRAPADL
jgi:hypothetical protein